MGEKQRGTTAHTHTRDCALVLANGRQRERETKWERRKVGTLVGEREEAREEEEEARKRGRGEGIRARGMRGVERVPEEKGEASHGSYSADRSATRVISREC